MQVIRCATRQFLLLRHSHNELHRDRFVWRSPFSPAHGHMFTSEGKATIRMPLGLLIASATSPVTILAVTSERPLKTDTRVDIKLTKTSYKSEFYLRTSSKRFGFVEEVRHETREGVCSIRGWLFSFLQFCTEKGRLSSDRSTEQSCCCLVVASNESQPEIANRYRLATERTGPFSFFLSFLLKPTKKGGKGRLDSAPVKTKKRAEKDEIKKWNSRRLSSRVVLRV